MSKKALINSILKYCEPVIEDLGYELVNLEYVKENNENYLRFYIWKSEGITIDDCQRVSEVVENKIDELDPIKESYYLEISSPGLDRPLKTDKDLKRNVGKEIEISLYKNLDGKKKYNGELIDYTDESIIIKMDNLEEKIIDRDIISTIKLSLKF